MARAHILSTGLLAFGAGIAVGAQWPRSSRILGFVLEKLGFQLGDALMLMWDPEEPAPAVPAVKTAAARSKRKRKPKVPAAKRKMPARRRSVKQRSFTRTREGILVTGLN